MPKQLQQERLLTITEAAKRSPGRPSVRTVWRWIERGVRGTRLEVLRAGGRTFTTAEALERFFAKLSGQGGE
jgi:hypothetical protein